MAINAPIQGTDADMAKIAMVMIDDWIKKNGLQDKVKMIAQVHDELLCEIESKDEDFINETMQSLQNIMEQVLEDFDLPKSLENLPIVPIKVGMKKGKNWGVTEG